METQNQNRNGRLKNLRRQLAIAVKSIQWSYAIFWSISSTQPGVLEWGEGYYNGDIKTRKTIQAGELSSSNDDDDDELGLQRSEQLRQLYESLSAAESNIKRPSASLSPEDLTDTEWYFLVCMSFVFNIGQGLPGRSLAKNQAIWLCNAHQADSKVFTRSLLAKSADIQTVFCFPYLGGVVELGVTELVSEDRNLIQHIKTNFLDNPNPIIIPKIPNYASNNTINDPVENIDFSPLIECEVSSPNTSTNDFESNQQGREGEEEEESYMVEALNGETSQVQSWQFIDDEQISNSMNSCDCISQTYANPAKRTTTLLPKCEEKSNIKKLDSFDFKNDDLHYQNVLSTLLKSSHQMILGTNSRRKNNVGSSFVNWKSKERSSLSSSLGFQKSRGGMSQRMLKKVLFEDVTRLHGDYWFPESGKENGKRERIWRPEADELDKNHAMVERKRREKMNERFLLLGSLVPSSSKVDKVSILDDTIEYLKELERRVEELEGRSRNRRPQEGAAERISDSYGSNKTANNRKSSSSLLMINKRKASDVEEMEHENNDHQSCMMMQGESSSEDLTVSVIDKNVLIEINCPWRESVLIEIMEAITDLSLESQAVQSSNTDGLLSLTIKCKFKGSSRVASASMIRQALQRVVRKS